MKTQVKRGPKSFLICIDEEEREVLLPVEYTNLGKSRLSDNHQGEAPFFAYNDLVELRRIMDSLI